MSDQERNSIVVKEYNLPDTAHQEANLTHSWKNFIYVKLNAQDKYG